VLIVTQQTQFQRTFTPFLIVFVCLFVWLIWPSQVLRGGVHYITDQLVLTHEHSHLHMLGYPGEEASVSGGVELTNLQWKPYNVTPVRVPVSLPFYLGFGFGRGSQYMSLPFYLGFGVWVVAKPTVK
jgi:hypothetical protein